VRFRVLTLDTYIGRLVQGYDSILVVVDRLTKMVHFIPTTEKTSAEGLARLFRDNVWKLHGLPESIISDRGPQFAAGLMRELNEMLGIKSKLSMAFHPQTDGQTERVNQELEQYLRMFIDHRQKQWPEWLGTAEFTYNNKAHSSTRTSPFKANYGQDPRIGFEARKKGKYAGYQGHVERERGDPEWSGITPEWKGVDNKSEGTTLASARVLCLDLLSRVRLCISGGQNCCQECRRGVVYRLIGVEMDIKHVNDFNL